MYSQNKEQQYIVDYFKDFKGTLLSVGENDGVTFSNSLRLIELGWKAVLVEPSFDSFMKLCERHKYNNKVQTVNAAIADKDGKEIFFESGSHLPDKSDNALLSSLKNSETERWRKSGVAFNETEVETITYKTLLSLTDNPTFDFITIDAEGMDIQILNQIDLTNTKLLCIEWNGDYEIGNSIRIYCSKFGMEKVIYSSAENLLIAR